MNSFNHYAFGSVGQYLYGAVAGINAASPGYKTLLLQPVPGTGLSWANASYDSVRGPISTAWTNVGNVFNLEVEIPPNTIAQVWVPTTNAGAITESGLPAATSPGVTYLGTSNNCAIFAVGSGQYFWSSALPVPPPPPAVTESDSVYAGGSFPALFAGDLLTNQSTTVTANSLLFGPENHLPAASLNDGLIGAPLTTNRSCEISGGAITFYLGPGANGVGYAITNLSTFTAWQDDGREDANYGVTYSRDGTNFHSLATVAYNPSPYPTKDGTGGTWTSLAVTNLAGVQYLQWNFSASQQNGSVGYSEVAAYGIASPLPPPSLNGSASAGGAGAFIMSTAGLVPGHRYQLQSNTNLLSPAWFTETNFIAAQGVVALTNSITDGPEKFYRLVGN
jgi:hypothetical protein